MSVASQGTFAPSAGPVPVICGPTAGGKSALAIRLAAEIARRGRGTAEIVTADAFQVYRGMDIGTAKPTPAERAAIPHHLLDLVEPSDSFSVDTWLRAAHAAIAAILARGALPIVVGGTHLYIKALLDGLFDGPPADPAVRSRLTAMNPEQRRQLLERVDPHAAARIHPNDARRTIRALEVFELTGVPISSHQTQWRGPRTPAAAPPGPDASLPPIRLVTLDWPVESLNRRINQRVRSMFDMGLIDEVRRVAARGFGPQAREALGYKQVLAALDSGGISTKSELEAVMEEIKIQTRRFAKNQRTWLKQLSCRAGTLVLRPEDSSPEEMTSRVLDHVESP